MPDKIRIYCDRYAGQASYFFTTNTPTSPPSKGLRRVAFDLDMPTDAELWPADVVGESRLVDPEDEDA